VSRRSAYGNDALTVVSPFLDTVLSRAAAGRWDPARRSWTASGVSA